MTNSVTYKRSLYIPNNSLESKTPVLLSKQGFGIIGMGSYFGRGLTLDQPNDRVLYTLRKKILSWNVYMLIGLQSSPELHILTL